MPGEAVDDCGLHGVTSLVENGGFTPSHEDGPAPSGTSPRTSSVVPADARDAYSTWRELMPIRVAAAEQRLLLGAVRGARKSL